MRWQRQEISEENIFRIFNDQLMITKCNLFSYSYYLPLDLKEVIKQTRIQVENVSTGLYRTCKCIVYNPGGVLGLWKAFSNVYALFHISDFLHPSLHLLSPSLLKFLLFSFSFFSPPFLFILSCSFTPFSYYLIKSVN